MKRLLSLLFLCPLNIVYAEQFLPEVVEVNIDFEISRCEAPANQIPICDHAASLGRNIRIELNNCSNDNGYEICQGSWQTTRSRDGFRFVADVSVKKETYGENEPGYTLSATVGPGLSSQRDIPVTVFFRNGAKLTDVLRVEGNWLWGG